MASIVEWQSLKMQEYRYNLLMGMSKFWSWFGLYRPVRYEQPVVAGDYNHALHVDHPDAPSFLDEYIHEPAPEPQLDGAPKQTEAPSDKEQLE